MSPATPITAHSAVFAPLDSGGRARAVERRLEGAIWMGLIADGEQLPSESVLSAQLGVSTVTLREALAMLRESGLVETRRGRGGGTFARAPAEDRVERLYRRVREISVDEIRDIGDHHQAVAGTAARLAAERAGERDVDRLREHAARLAQADSIVARHRADVRFEVEVAAASHSARLTAAELELQWALGGLPWLAREDPGAIAEAVADRRAIVAAIHAREGERARQIAERRVAADTLRLIEFHLELVEPDRAPEGA